MKDIRTWILVVCVVILVVVLVRYARGPEHRRGDDVGAWSPPIVHVNPGV
jgi:hypothetical protein